MSTTDKLRADIDAGRTRDKVAGTDPAAAPLGTDEEAAGRPIDPAAVATARQREVRGGARTNEDAGVLFYIVTIALIAIVMVGGGLVFFLR